MNSSICLTFDDLFLSNWLEVAPLFKRFDAKVTFFIGPVRNLSIQDFELLKRIEGEGHEIGYHTFSHPKLKRFLKFWPKEKYISQEIEKGMNIMNSHGFQPKSFAYPFFGVDLEITLKMQSYFSFIRGGGAARTALDVTRRVYRSKQALNLYHNLGQIDFSHPRFSVERFSKQVAHTKKLGGVSIYTGHDISTDRSERIFHSTNVDMERALQVVSDAGIPMETCQAALEKLSGESQTAEL